MFDKREDVSSMTYPFKDYKVIDNDFDQGINYQDEDQKSKIKN